jgi:hypothetical protein
MTVKNYMPTGAFQFATVSTCLFLLGASTMRAGREDMSNLSGSVDWWRHTNNSRCPKEKFNVVIGKLSYQHFNNTVCLTIISDGSETHDNVDAANDAHSGFVIFNRFAAMAQAMDSVPNPNYYSFNTINGHFLDSSGIAWSPSNPEYDPGPPPPPKPPKPPRAPQATAPTDVAAVKASTSIIQVNRSPTKPRTSFAKIEDTNQQSSSSHGIYFPAEDSRLALVNGTDPPSRTKRSQWRPRGRRGSIKEQALKVT